MIKHELDVLKDTDQRRLNKKQRREDKVLTRLFNNLQNDPKRTAKAMHKNGGGLTLNVGASNTTKEFFQSACGLIKNPFLSPSYTQIEENVAFQEYKAKLNAEGLDVDISYCDEYDNLAKTLVITNRIGPVAIGLGLVLGGPLLASLAVIPTALSYAFTGMASSVSGHKSSMTLKIKKQEQQPQMLAIENKSVELVTANLAIENKVSQTQDILAHGILDELNKKTAKQPHKQRVTRPAII